MTETSKFIYKLGGYDPKVIEKIDPITRHFGMKYLIPGLSLFIVFLTAGYGGWHFTATLINKEDSDFVMKHMLGTLFFAFFVFFIDYIMLNSPKNRWMLYLRGSFSLTIGLLVGLLSTLSFFSERITAEIASQKNELLRPIDSSYDKKIDTLKNRIKVYEEKIVNDRDILRDQVEGRRGLGPGYGFAARQIQTNITNDSLGIEKLRFELPTELAKIEADRKRDVSRILEEFDDKNILSQIESLWRLMSRGAVIFLALIFFLGITLADLIPLFAKISKDYSNDYDPYKEFVEGLEDSIKINKEEIPLDFTDIERIKMKNDNDLNRFNEDALKKINSLYALEKYGELIEYFKTKNIPEEAIKQIFEKLHEEANRSSSNGQ